MVETISKQAFAEYSPMVDDIVIFGASSGGRQVYEKLHSKANIVAFLDNDPNKQGQAVCGIPVINPENIHSLDYLNIVTGKQIGRAHV